MRNAAWMRFFAVAATLVALAAIGSPAAAQSPPPAAPVLVFANPKDGDTLAEPPFFLQVCFAEPINVKDLDKGGDFNFSLTAPDDMRLGLRIVFQPDGYGAAIYPGDAPGETEGDWTFEWHVSSPDASETAEGEIGFTVDPAGEPVPTSTPLGCIGAQGTATPGVIFGETPTGNASATPTATGGEDGDGSPTPRENGETVDEDDDPDILPLALLTIGAAGGFAVLAVIGYLIRKRVGYDPHKPGPGDDTGHH